MNGKQFLLILVTVSIVFFLCYLNYKNCNGCINTDYQINVHNDTIWLYDGSRLVGKVLNTWNSSLDSLILKDNN